MQPPRSYGAIPSTTSNGPPGAQALDEPWRSKILITGLRRSGKSSIQQVVFHDVPPKETFYLETTTRITKDNIDSIVALQLWDCPGNVSFENLGVPLASFSTIIFVIDIQDEYHYPISHLVDLIATAADANPKVNLEVFVHKAEALSDEYKVENFRQIQSRVLDDLLDHPSSQTLLNLPLNFYLTSVYDHTIYEAFSRVIQRLIPQLPTLEDLLNSLCTNSGIVKAFLFDVTCLLYVATDISPVDNASFELCCDYVQTLVNFSNLYKNLQPKKDVSVASPSQSVHTPSSSVPSSHSNNSQLHASDPSFHEQPVSWSSSPSHSLIATTKTHVPPRANGNGLQRSNSTASTGTKNGSPVAGGNSSTLDRLLSSEQDPRRWASSAAKLTPETTLTYWQITDSLALVALVRSSTFEKHKGLIEYNVTFFRSAIQQVAELELEKRQRP